jgi:CheY-like chemotaxis protein
MIEISILLVEDNEDDRFLTTRMIRKLPLALKIETAKNGDDALKRIMANELGIQELPSLILLDLQLPKIDGIKFLTSVRQRYNEKELPVIILSSSDNPGDIALCRELGINGYLAKPLELSHLQLLLKNLVGNQSTSLLSGPLQGHHKEESV